MMFAADRDALETRPSFIPPNPRPGPPARPFPTEARRKLPLQFVGKGPSKQNSFRVKCVNAEASGWVILRYSLQVVKGPRTVGWQFSFPLHTPTRFLLQIIIV